MQCSANLCCSVRLTRKGHIEMVDRGYFDSKIVRCYSPNVTRCDLTARFCYSLFHALISVEGSEGQL